jgi:hypothetical protein
MTETINGWTPPLVYDLGTDTRRVATQDDVDDMQRKLMLLGGFYTGTKRAIEDLARNLANSGNATVASAAIVAAKADIGPKPKGCLRCGKGVGQ